MIFCCYAVAIIFPIYSTDNSKIEKCADIDNYIINIPYCKDLRLWKSKIQNHKVANYMNHIRNRFVVTQNKEGSLSFSESVIIKIKTCCYVRE